MIKTPASASAPAGSTVTLIGSGFGKNEGTVLVGDQSATEVKWSESEIDFTLPASHKDLPALLDLAVLGAGTKSILFSGKFMEMPVTATMSPIRGVAGTSISINGSHLPPTQGNNKVIFRDIKGDEELAGTVPSSGWTGSGITVQVPDFGEHKTAAKGKGKQPVGPKDTGDIDLAVSIVDQNNQTVATVTPPPVAKGTAPKYFTETPPQWSDKDEKPASIKIVGGYEEGFQSAQAANSDVFLAVYGRSLFLEDKFGPFYDIRLQSSPQASGTYGVVSVLTNPSGAVTSQNLQSVGSAVDFTLGLEYQLWNKLHRGQTSIGLIAGGGFVTPLQTNSVNATYSMPAFGTVECTELQSRLSGVLSNPVYAGIQANTASTSTSCYTNKTTSTSVNVAALEYNAPNQPNLFSKYAAGLRFVNRFPGASKLKQCDENTPCERGYIDFTLGQNASISGGTMKHLVANIDTIYPLPIPNLNFLYLFGSASKRFYDLPPNQSPLVLALPPASGPSSLAPPPNPAILVLPLTQPDRDFYRIGIGVNICQIFSALTTKSSSGALMPCKF